MFRAEDDGEEGDGSGDLSERIESTWADDQGRGAGAGRTGSAMFRGLEFGEGKGRGLGTATAMILALCCNDEAGGVNCVHTTTCGCCAAEEALRIFAVLCLYYEIAGLDILM